MLLHTPNLTGKLELVWYGPYEVTKRLEETTYQLAVPERRNHKIVAHANRLKPWKDLSVNLSGLWLHRNVLTLIILWVEQC